MVPEQRVKTCTYQVCHMVPEQRVKTCTYQVCHMVPEQRVKTCTYQVCHMVPEQRVKTCTYQVCHMVPEQRVKTCTYQVCHMVPEQRVKTCTYQVCHFVKECHSVEIPYKVCHMVAEQRREAGAVYGLQAGVLHQDDQLREVRAEGRVLHGHPVRPGGRVQASAGQGILPGAVLLRPDGLRPGLWLRQLSEHHACLLRPLQKVWSSNRRRPGCKVGPPFCLSCSSPLSPWERGRG